MTESSVDFVRAFFKEWALSSFTLRSFVKLNIARGSSKFTSLVDTLVSSSIVTTDLGALLSGSSRGQKTKGLSGYSPLKAIEENLAFAGS